MPILKSLLSFAVVLIFCPICYPQDGAERLNEFGVESFSTSLPCSFNFEIISLSGRPGDPPESERVLGSVTKDGKGATRVDYSAKDLSVGISRVFHSLRISPKERFAAYRDGNSVRFFTIKEDSVNPIRIVDVDPFRLIFFPSDAVFVQSAKSGDLKSLLGRHSVIRNAKSDEFYYFGLHNGLFVNRIRFDSDNPPTITEVSTFVSPEYALPPAKRTGKGIESSDQASDYRMFKSVKVIWKDVNSVGFLPETISAVLTGNVVQEPEKEHEVQIRFFNYNFDKEKLDFSLCTREAFTQERLLSTFDVKNVQFQLDNTDFKSPRRSR